MTSVLVVDPNPDNRRAVQQALTASNQFERVLACPNFDAAERELASAPIEVMLVADSLARSHAVIEALKSRMPALGVVVVREPGDLLDAAGLKALGMDAQTSRSASPMELIASVAKALVASITHSPRHLKKLLKD